ncbi:MAG: DUF5320 domain-containing protein [Dehalococcoidales bacterium]|nr:DUF5320 domain-containing protein [Dehalococcoidales bacterium]
MPGFDGTGPMGMGPMTGGGRGFCSPWGVGTRNYAFPRRLPYNYPSYGGYGFSPFVPRMSREQELEFLKGQAEALRGELKELENEIKRVSSTKK